MAPCDVARAAGVADREAVRHFADRGKLLRGVVQERLTPRVEDVRYRHAAGDLDAAISALVDDYEGTGDAILRALAREPRLPELGYAVDQWRESHKRWICWAFSSLVEGVPADEQWARLEQLADVLDVGVWSAHRRDLGRQREDTAKVLRRRALSVLGRSDEQDLDQCMPVAAAA
jgi:AcrR family transcriptional regulator